MDIECSKDQLKIVNQDAEVERNRIIHTFKSHWELRMQNFNVKDQNDLDNLIKQDIYDKNAIFLQSFNRFHYEYHEKDRILTIAHDNNHCQKVYFFMDMSNKHFLKQAQEMGKYVFTKQYLQSKEYKPQFSVKK